MRTVVSRDGCLGDMGPPRVVVTGGGGVVGRGGVGWGGV